LNFQGEPPEDCWCPDCGTKHAASISVALDSKDTLELFVATFQDYLEITQHLPVDSGNLVVIPLYGNPPTDLPFRLLRIVALRKYMFAQKDKVYLPRIASAIGELDSNHAGWREYIDAEFSLLNSQQLNPILELIHDGKRETRSLNSIVLDYVYGIFLHGDYRRMINAFEGGGAPLALAASRWVSIAEGLVRKTYDLALPLVDGARGANLKV
jgi:hypothetical protein